MNGRFADAKAINLVAGQEATGGRHVPRHNPQVLMLDESMAGLTPTEIHDASGMIRSCATKAWR